MATWAFVLCGTDGTPRRDLWGVTNRKLTWAVDGPAKFSFDAVDDTDLDELTRDIVAYRDGSKVWRGRLGPSKDTFEPGSHTSSWSAFDYRGVLAHRDVFPDFQLSYNNLDQGYIMYQLLWSTQSEDDGDLGLDLSELPQTGTVLRDFTAKVGKPVADTIDELSQTSEGFDWWVDSDLVVHAAHPHRGSTVAWAAVIGATALKIERVADTSAYASDAVVTSDGQTPHVSSRTPRTRGRWDTSLAITNAGAWAMAVKSSWLLDQSAWLPAITVTVDPDRWTPDDAWLGDTIDVHIHQGRIDEIDACRIVQIEVTLDDDGGETIKLGLNRILRREREQLADLRRRVGDLERA